MDLFDFSEGGLDVVILSYFGEVSGHGVLTGGHFDTIRFLGNTRREQSFIPLKIFHPECSTHHY